MWNVSFITYYNVLFNPETMDSRTQTNTYFNTKVTQKSLVSKPPIPVFTYQIYQDTSPQL